MSDTEAHFKAFWDAYPRKVGKAIARTIYGQITGNGRVSKARDSAHNTYELDLYASHEDLLNAAKVFAYRMAMDETPVTFIKHASTWLNQGCFEDEEDHIEEYLVEIQRIEATKTKLQLVK